MFANVEKLSKSLQSNAGQCGRNGVAGPVMPGFADQRGEKIGVQIPPAQIQSPENLKILVAFFVYRKILEASARFPLHVHALVQGFGSDSATPLGHPTASPVLEVNADQNQLLH